MLGNTFQDPGDVTTVSAGDVAAPGVDKTVRQASTVEMKCMVQHAKDLPSVQTAKWITLEY